MSAPGSKVDSKRTTDSGAKWSLAKALTSAKCTTETHTRWSIGLQMSQFVSEIGENWSVAPVLLQEKRQIQRAAETESVPAHPRGIKQGHVGEALK
jgi:hypothetical protein